MKKKILIGLVGVLTLVLSIMIAANQYGIYLPSALYYRDFGGIGPDNYAKEREAMENVAKGDVCEACTSLYKKHLFQKKITESKKTQEASYASGNMSNASRALNEVVICVRDNCSASKPAIVPDLSKLKTCEDCEKVQKEKERKEELLAMYVERSKIAAGLAGDIEHLKIDIVRLKAKYEGCKKQYCEEVPDTTQHKAAVKKMLCEDCRGVDEEIQNTKKSFLKAIKRKNYQERENLRKKYYDLLEQKKKCSRNKCETSIEK